MFSVFHKVVGLVLLLNIGLVLLLFIPVANANITNLNANVGNNYINWSWNYGDNTTKVSLFLDGQFITNTSLTSFILSDLNSREQHILVIKNATNTTESTAILGTNSVKTFYPPILFYLILIFSIGFLLLEIFLKNATLTIMIGTLCFVMSILGFYMSYPYYFSILSYLMIGIAVIALLWVMMAGFSLITKESNAEEDII